MKFTHKCINYMISFNSIFQKLHKSIHTYKFLYVKITTSFAVSIQYNQNKKKIQLIFLDIQAELVIIHNYYTILHENVE